MGRDAGVRICFRRGQDEDLAGGRFFSVERAVPEVQIAFPWFEVARSLRDDGERLTALALQSRNGKRTRRARHQPADRDYTCARAKLIEQLTVFTCVSD